MKTGNKKRGDLFRFLAENYVFFTVMNLVILTGIYLVLSAYADHIAPTPDAAGLLRALSTVPDRELGRLSFTSWLGKDSGLVVLDGEGKVLCGQADAKKVFPEKPSAPKTALPQDQPQESFAQEAFSQTSFLQETLSCIPEYAADNRVLVAELPEGAEGGSYLLTRAEYLEDGSLGITGYAFLDENRAWKSGTILQRENPFTEEELNYLMGRDGQGRSIYRYSYENPEGQPRKAVFWMREAGSEEYRLFYRVVDGIKWFILPIYLGTAAFCIFWLSRRVKRLLAPLNAAVANLAADQPSGLQGYEGPVEFKELADNFLNMEKALKESERERQRLDEEKRKLLSDISHDLKTPITVIQGYAAALRDGLTAPGDRKKYLDTISRKADRLNDLIQTFHEYSRLDRPDMPVRRKSEDICGIVREYFAQRYQELELAGFEVEASIPEESIRVEADRMLLERAMENIVNNAAAYNPPGTRILVEVDREGEFARIVIADDGNGIPDALKKNLFQPFVTGDAARGSSHGSGLGLAITAKILKLHGGSVRLADPPSGRRGAEFILLIPVQGEGGDG